MSDKPNPTEILNDGAETYESKNEDYGDSWRKVGEILHLLADGQPVTLETKKDHISYGLFTRRLDKFARAFHGEFFDDDPNHEPVVDAHEDEMVYAAMASNNLQSTYECDGRADRKSGDSDRAGNPIELGDISSTATISTTTREISTDGSDSSRGPPE